MVRKRYPDFYLPLNRMEFLGYRQLLLNPFVFGDLMICFFGIWLDANTRESYLRKLALDSRQFASEYAWKTGTGRAIFKVVIARQDNEAH